MCSFVFIFSLLLTELQMVLTVKDMLSWFVFYEYLGAAEKNKKTIEVFLSISLEWLNNALFGKKSPQGLGLASCAMLFANRDMDVYLSVNWNPGTAARAHRAHGFYLTNRPQFFVVYTLINHRNDVIKCSNVPVIIRLPHFAIGSKTKRFPFSTPQVVTRKSIFPY